MPDKESQDASQEQGIFKVGDQTLLLAGTSGLSQHPQQTAEAQPTRHDLMVAGQAMVTTGTSGPSNLPLHTAIGQPLLHSSASAPQASSVSQSVTETGSGQLVGQPTRTF